MNEIKALTVKQLNLYVKSILDGDFHLADVTVVGEISNFKNHYSSGHWYFTLKDENAAIRSVMFKSSADKVGFEPEDGMSVVIRGRVSLYEKDGQYQFYAEQMFMAGAGPQSLQFEKIKEKLEKEGLFDPESKRQIKKYPNRIAVVTSDTGAALRDVLNITSERFPLCDILLCPVLVQGEDAPADIIKTLDRLYKLDGIDTIIITRGGGSSEDLSAFNNEELARKIFKSPVPVISGVGHETDFSICDFVADLRASTPSHAATLATPDSEELCSYLNEFNKTFQLNIQNKHQMYEQRFLSAKYVFSYKNPLNFVEDKVQSLDIINDKFKSNLNGVLLEQEKKLALLVSRIDALSPLKTLSRGFCSALKGEKVIKSAAELNRGDSLNLRFFDGTVNCTVERGEKNNG